MAEKKRELPANVNLAETETSRSTSRKEPVQEKSVLAYQDDPKFRELLERFQTAEWEECLKKVNQLLSEFPEDKFLVEFKQDVEIRLHLRQTTKEQDAKEAGERRQKLRFRALTIGILVLTILLLTIWGNQLYKEATLEQEARLTAESLAAKHDLAETLMQAGRAEEALPIFNEIQKINPSYNNIGQDIQSAKQAIYVEDLYQQGTQALQEAESAQALDFFLMVEQLHPKYKDTPQLIEKIQGEQQIASLIQDIHLSYSKGDWAGVIHDYEAIQEIDPFIEITDLNDELFFSYKQLIIDTAGRQDTTLADIETAAKYYRLALVLSLQSQEYAKDREELKKVADDLLANRYYLQGISLLESSNYSIDGLQDSIRALRGASSKGVDSPALKAGIERAQLFLNSYNSLIQRKWDAAIKDLETLYHKDRYYAGGRVPYFLYEAYTARGDLLLANADFGDAFADYQEAEKHAWGASGNLLRLFQIEVRVAATLHKLGRDKEAAAYYHYAFEQLGYRDRLEGPENQALLNTLIQADSANKDGDELVVIGLYEEALKQEDKLYDQIIVVVSQGETLLNIAFVNGTSLTSLRHVNQLGEGTVIDQSQELLVPVIPANGQ